MDSVLVRFHGKNYYVSYADLLNKANNKLFAYEDEELTKNAKLNGKTLMFNKKDMEDKLKKDIKMSSPMPGAAKTESIQEKEMTKEQKLRKYIREMVIKSLYEDAPYGQPDEALYLFKTDQDYLQGIQGDSGIDEEAEQPSAEELAAKQKAAEESKRKAAYQRFFSQALAKFGYSSPASIPDEKKKSFYDYIDANWTSKQEEPIQETSATGGVAGYETPAAFTGKKDISKKQKSIANQLGYELVDKSYAVKDQGDVQDLKENLLKETEFGSKEEFIEYLQDTLIPDLRAGGSDATADDFEEAIYWMTKGEEFRQIMKGINRESIVNEGLDSYYFKDENLTAEQKLGLAMRQVRNNLYEVEKVVQRTIKMKNEENVDSSKVGKRTYSALKRINEKVIRLMVALQELK